MNFRPFIIFVSFFLIIACDKNPYHRDVSDIQVDFQTIPFHSDVLVVGMNNDSIGFQDLQAKYGAFLKTYIADVGRTMQIPGTRSELEILHTFVINKWIQELYRLSDSTLQKHLSEIDEKIL